MLESIPQEKLKAIASFLAAHLRLSLFGFDLILEKASGRYYIIDVNYFPGERACSKFAQGKKITKNKTNLVAYGGVKEFHQKLLELIKSQVK